MRKGIIIVNIGSSAKITMSEDKVQNLHFDVKASSKTPVETVVETPGSEIIIRDPEAYNKFDRLVNPEEYLLGSLAGCISRIAHIVAYEKDLELEELNIDIGGEINPSKFLGEESKEGSKFREIDVKIKADIEADEEEFREWIRQIRERSQIVDTVENSVSVNIGMSRL